MSGQLTKFSKVNYHYRAIQRICTDEAVSYSCDIRNTTDDQIESGIAKKE